MFKVIPFLLFTMIVTQASAYSATVILEQNNSNRFGIDWDKINLMNNQSGKMVSQNGLLYNKSIPNICDRCYFYDAKLINTDVNGGVVKYNVQPNFNGKYGEFNISMYAAVARCGEFTIHETNNLITNNGIFQKKILCTTNTDKAIIVTISIDDYPPKNQINTYFKEPN